MVRKGTGRPERLIDCTQPPAGFVVEPARAAEGMIFAAKGWPRMLAKLTETREFPPIAREFRRRPRWLANMFGFFSIRAENISERLHGAPAFSRRVRTHHQSRGDGCRAGHHCVELQPLPLGACTPSDLPARSRCAEQSAGASESLSPAGGRRPDTCAESGGGSARAGAAIESDSSGNARRLRIRSGKTIMMTMIPYAIK